MKKLFIISALFMLSTVVMSATDPVPEKNSLTLSGIISSTEKTTILVFVHDTADCTWSMTEQHLTKKNYRLELNPEKAYQIWFQNPGGYLRVVYVDPGDAGIWNAQLSINFDPESLAFIHLYQTCLSNSTDYFAEFVGSRRQAEKELPATNCEYCNKKIPEPLSSN